MPRDLIFEIGTEEIPAGYLARALEHLVDAGRQAFADARLQIESLHTWGTPRRIALCVAGLADQQPELREQVVGPPARVAFDADGQPTKAALGFAKRNGVEVSELARTSVDGKKGEYVVCERRQAGRPAIEVLPELLGDLLRAIPWPKSMRWGNTEDTFVRPVHWIVALLGTEIVPLSFAQVEAGRATRGHRFLAPDSIELADASATTYSERLREAFVIVDPQRRIEIIRAELEHLGRQVAGRVRPDDALLREVAFLVEYPKAVCGEFDESFLEVPEEVIVSAMRSHQRYFSMENEFGALTNRFITVAGTVTRDLDVVKAGNERVLAARLEDAAFFFREDRKRSLDEYARKLNLVVFQAELGSVGDKVKRIRQIAAELAAEVGVATDLVARAAALCKADLVTQMVGEFPDLQGVMGAHYAWAAGEPAEVADAIREHYQPKGANDEPPTGGVGAVVAIADRIDTLVACFAVGLTPSGSADPYGLRRAALGILTILMHREWAVPLSMLVQSAAASLRGTVDVRDEHREGVLEFLRKRLQGMLLEESEPDCIEAVLESGFDYVPDVRARALAVSAFRRRADFQSLGAAFKRVANILKGKSPSEMNPPNPDLFQEDEESALWLAFGDIRRRARECLAKRDYAGALTALADLKAPVDRFFDTVLVMDDDPEIRENRLALLGSINSTFNRIADFRQLAV